MITERDTSIWKKRRADIRALHVIGIWFGVICPSQCVGNYSIGWSLYFENYNGGAGSWMKLEL